jgi:hypothetical protein
MASNNSDRNKEKENEYFLDAIEAVNYDSDSSNNNNDDDDEDDRIATHRPESFTSQQWPQSYKYVTS